MCVFLSVRYKKKQFRKTANLLTGETEATEDEQRKIREGVKQEIVSHWHPNITVNVVNDYTPWVPGQVSERCNLEHF